MRAVIYARVSTTGKGQRPENQLDEARQFCAARGWDVAYELSDEGYSGSTAVRPGLKRLEELVRSRAVDVVVVVKLDRLFRSLRHLVTVLDEYQARGVLFTAIRDPVDYTTPTGRLVAQILGSLAEFERELIRERILMGVLAAKARGKRLGRPPRIDGKRALALRKQGLSLNAIAKALGTTKSGVSKSLKRQARKVAEMTAVH